MNGPNQNLAPNSFELSPLFIEISRELLNETYALEHHFRALSLTEMGLILEEGPAHDSVDPESYEKCKSHYCMLLIELELAGHEHIPEFLNTHSLDSLVHAETPEASEELAPAPNLETQLENSTVLTEPKKLDGFSPLVPSDLDANQNTPELLETLPENATTLIENEQDLEPQLLSDSEELIELTSQHEPQVQNALGEFSKEIIMGPYDPLRAKIGHSLSKNYLHLAIHFHHLMESGDSNLSLVTVRKLVGQFLCSLTEVEILSAIKEQVHAFWPGRKEAIQSLISESSFTLKPELLKHFDKYSELYCDWLYEGKFPVASITRCLRFVVLTDDVTKFNPSCLELGALIYLFGHNSQDEKSNAVKNLLELNPLPNKELIELCFRLSRLEFLKAKALDHYSHFDNDHIEVIKEDVFRTLELVRKMYPLETEDLYFDENDIKDVA